FLPFLASLLSKVL
uniref:Temporin-1Cd n=1 Tax=Lithobates clamitans TaxID=145282 RepID=TP1D_LITCL|nr:RecName: Full=Temporin-1Cd [Lithobates clamitans]